MTASFESIFRSGCSRRDKLVARLFGIFSEDVVRVWASCEAAPYEDQGRPTIRRPGAARGSTLDFTLKRRDGGGTFVAELKCELEYEDYRYLRLDQPAQVEHHRQKDAFQRLLDVAHDPNCVDVRVRGHPAKVDGAILIWGTVSETGRTSVINTYGFAEVLAVSSMIADLNLWRPDEWTAFLADRRNWTNSLFDGIASAVGA